MGNKICNKLLLVQILLFFGIISLTFAQSNIDSSLKNNDEKPQDHKSLLEEINRVDTALHFARNAAETFSDSAFLPQILFQLSEWEFRSSRLHYNLEMEKYDHKMQLFQKDSTKYPPPEEPCLSYQPTLEINHQILQKYPDVLFRDKVIYRTGICLYEIGQHDSARTLFLELVNQYPDSAYIPEMIFRIGECYFDEQQFEKALETYNKVLEFWNSPFFAMALYKRAWCYYRLNDYPQAISTFFYLLSDIKLMEDLDSEILGKSQVELRDEAIEYIAISFTDFGGMAMALSFINDIGGSEYTAHILHKMSQVYLKRDFYEEAISVSKKLLKLFPLYKDAPQVQYNIFQCYEKLGDKNKALGIRKVLITKYGSNSAWAKYHNGKEDNEKVNKLIELVDFKIATPYLNRADSLFTAEKYALALQTYKNFLKTFPDDDRIDHAAYYLAESFYQLKNYKAAAVSYRYVAKNIIGSELREDAAYNRIVCYDNLLNDEIVTTRDTLQWIQSKKFFLIPLQSRNQRDLIFACKDFIKWFPQADKTTEVRLKLAEMFMKMDQCELAETLLNSILIAMIKHRRDIEHYAKALCLMAQANFKQKDFRNAEKWYTLLIREFPDSLELIKRSKTMLASASFKVAETFKEKGNAKTAALKFEKAATVAQDLKVAQAALYEAAVQFEKIGKYQRAAINFEAFCKKYPNSQNIEQALYHAASLREKLCQWYLAAKNYLQLYHCEPHSAKGASALFKAGIDFENANDWSSMAQTFNEFVTKFPNMEDRLLEAIFKIGYAHEQRGKSLQAVQVYEQIVNKHRQFQQRGKFADDFVAAHARFRLGEMRHKEFSSIKLKPPFQKHLKKKQTAFNKMLAYFIDVAKYNVAEWTTAAFYNAAYAYEEFCQDILNSPAPPNLSGEQLKNYWDMIHQKWILPLQAEALKYYRLNDKLAAENNIENEWTNKTKSRIMYLSKKLATFKGSANNILKQTIGTVDNRAKTKKTNL